MIHGSKRVKKQKSEQEEKEEEELSNKINNRLADFFAIDRTQIKIQQIPTYMQFTALLMQLCSDIPSIFNFRRELIVLGLPAEAEARAKLYQSELKLTTKLIQQNPKSYTIWSYRQWLVLALFDFGAAVLQAQRDLCRMLLMKDQKNFHVWNYRNWVNSIGKDLQGEIVFTGEKIKSNPFNFSPYHFRSKLIMQKYQQAKQKEIICWGMPKKLLNEELESVRTAIYLNPNEEAPWLYYNWLLGQLVPGRVVARIEQQNSVVLYFNMKVGEFKNCCIGESKLELVEGRSIGDVWKVNKTTKIDWNLDNLQIVKKENTGRLFLGERKDDEAIVTEIKELYKSQLNFLSQVIQSEDGRCRFGWTQRADICRFLLQCGGSQKQWSQIVNIGLSSIIQLCSQTKNKKYLGKQRQYWQRLSSNNNLTMIQQALRNFL